MRKILLIFLLVFILWCTKSSAQQFRNIFSFTHLDYSHGGAASVYENSLIGRINTSASILLRGYHDNRSAWDNTIVYLGPIFNLDKHHYIEFTYGYGRDSDEREANYFTAELTREKTRYLLGLGYRYSAYPGFSYNVISPSVRYLLTPRLALWGKYFASMDSDSNFDNAYWIDGEYKITNKIALRLGFTGGNRLYSPEYESILGGKADMGFFSFLAQMSFVVNESFKIKYQYENLLRQSKYTDIKNILIVDIRF